LGQLTTEYQSAAGAVHTMTTPNVQYAYSFVSGSGGPNHSRLVSMTYPNGRVVSYNYNAGVDDRISRLSSLSDSQNVSEAYSYLGLDTVVQRAQMAGATAVATLSYAITGGGGTSDGGDQYTGLDRFGRIYEQRWLNPHNNNAISDDYLYTYDRDGNRLSRQTPLDPLLVDLYGYDSLNRLTSVTRPGHNQSWTLDAAGNWLSHTNSGSTQTRSFNNQNQLTAISGATTPSYDANGNTTKDDNATTYTFDAWNRLVQEVSGPNTLVYGYDGLGRRSTITLNGSTTDLCFSLAWQVIEEVAGSTVEAQYVWSPVYVDALVVRDVFNNISLFVQQDANWNVTSVVDGTSFTGVKERYYYDPYGKPSFYTSSWQTESGSAYNWIYLRYNERLVQLPQSGSFAHARTVDGGGSRRLRG
jgi:YD repeat-containing protein